MSNWKFSFIVMTALTGAFLASCNQGSGGRSNTEAATAIGVNPADVSNTTCAKSGDGLSYTCSFEYGGRVTKRTFLNSSGHWVAD